MASSGWEILAVMLLSQLAIKVGADAFVEQRFTLREAQKRGRICPPTKAIESDRHQAGTMPLERPPNRRAAIEICCRGGNIFDSQSCPVSTENLPGKVCPTAKYDDGALRFAMVRNSPQIAVRHAPQRHFG